MDEGTQKQEVQAQVQQAAAAVEQTKAVAHEMARRANAAGAALNRVRTAGWTAVMACRFCLSLSCVA